MSLVYGHFTIQGHRYVNWHGGDFSSYLLLHHGLIREPLCLAGSLLLQRLLLWWLLLHLCARLLQSSPCTGK